MQQQFEIEAQSRDQANSNGNRRMRVAGQVPAIVYGGKPKPKLLSINHNELMQHLQNEAFYSHILTLKIKGKNEKVILRDIQRHPSKAQVLHIDFLRVSEHQQIKVHVPLHFINEDTCIGVKQQGGLISHMQTDVEVSCLPKDLPEYLEVDVADLGLGHSLHLSDLELPKDVSLVALSHGEASDAALVSVIMPRVAEVSEAEEAAEAEDTEEQPPAEDEQKSEQDDKEQAT